jgi:hypothetical protein
LLMSPTVSCLYWPLHSLSCTSYNLICTNSSEFNKIAQTAGPFSEKHIYWLLSNVSGIMFQRLLVTVAALNHCDQLHGLLHN